MHRAAIAVVGGFAAGAFLASTAHVRPPATSPDIGGWMQRRLDGRGGVIFLPRLSGGRCYHARGLWVSRNHTTLTSNGACLSVLGPGPVRLHSADGDPIAASAAFFVARSSPGAPPPDHVTIRGLRIHVHAGSLDGIDIYARHVRIANVTIDGAPFDDVYIGGRTNVITYSRDVSLTDSTLLNAERNDISITAAVNVRIERNRIAGAGDDIGPAADPGAGIDVEPNAPADAIVALRIADNKIVGNIREGLALRLHPHGRPSLHADRIALTGNEILGNYPFGGGPQVALSGGQANHRGRVLIAGNRFSSSDQSLKVAGALEETDHPAEQPQSPVKEAAPLAEGRQRVRRIQACGRKNGSPHPTGPSSAARSSRREGAPSSSNTVSPPLGC